MNLTALQHFDVEANERGRLNLRCTRCRSLDRLESPALTLATLVARAERHDHEDHPERPAPGRAEPTGQPFRPVVRGCTCPLNARTCPHHGAASR